MAIRDKDGSVYKLRGPNPLMERQEIWNPKKTKVFNLKGTSELTEAEDDKKDEFEGNVVKINEDLGLVSKDETKVVYPDEFIGDIQSQSAEIEIEVEEPVAEEPVAEEPVAEEPVAEDEIVFNLDPRAARMMKERSSTFHCVPKTGSEDHHDDLFGDSYSTSIYGDKFLFDGVIVDESDLQIQFWSVKQIPVGSIILKKITKGGERWWKIIQSQPQEDTGGFLAIAITSDVNPSF